jgi:hypothetical protein
MIVSALLLLHVVFATLTIFVRDFEIMRVANRVLNLVGLSYSTWFYYQYFSTFGYRRVSLFMLSLVAVVLPLVVIIGGVLLLLY